MLVERKVKLITRQNEIPEVEPVEGGFPMREWSVRVLMLDDKDEEHEADMFTKVVYNLHPSFENPVQTFTETPFICSNEGWGAFEMTVDMYTTEKGKVSVVHDLNFLEEEYEKIYPVTFKNPSQALQSKLRETGPLPSDGDSRPKKKNALAGLGNASGSSSRKQEHKYDYERLASSLVNLNEDDIGQVIQMINDHRTDEMYIKNDLDAGEFSIDLYTMPESLTRLLSEFLSEKDLED
jgi:transcription initiation factor TFIID/TFIIF subunit